MDEGAARLIADKRDHSVALFIKIVRQTHLSVPSIFVASFFISCNGLDVDVVFASRRADGGDYKGVQGSSAEVLRPVLD